MNFEAIKTNWDWRPIRNCPGRFVLRAAGRTISPADVGGAAAGWREFRVERAVDPVLVAEVEGGGLISYRKKDGTFLHTLNTPEGFARKLAQLEIEL